MVHFGGSEVTRPFFEVTEEKIPSSVQRQSQEIREGFCGHHKTGKPTKTDFHENRDTAAKTVIHLRL